MFCSVILCECLEVIFVYLDLFVISSEGRTCYKLLLPQEKDSYDVCITYCSQQYSIEIRLYVIIVSHGQMKFGCKVQIVTGKLAVQWERKRSAAQKVV